MADIAVAKRLIGKLKKQIDADRMEGVTLVLLELAKIVVSAIENKEREFLGRLLRPLHILAISEDQYDPAIRARISMLSVMVGMAYLPENAPEPNTQETQVADAVAEPRL